MNERDIKIIKAALELFARYGVAKTTMNDIAREAGVARQTLYNAYPNKEEVMRAAVRHSMSGMQEAIEAAWQSEPSFARKLDHFFEHGPLSWYDAVQGSPHGAELIDGIHTVAAHELEAAGAYWKARFRELIEAEIKTPGTDTETLADFLYATAANAKYDAPTRQVLENRLATLKASLLALMG